MPRLGERYRSLTTAIAGLQRVAIAYSGGVDSTLVLKAAADALRRDDVMAVTTQSPMIPARDVATASRICEELGILHRIVTTSELDDPAIVSNPNNRCYYCKNFKYGQIIALAEAEGYHAVLDGTNYSDLDDYRPGMQATKNMPMVKSPLLDLRFTKEEIRELAHWLNLPNWDQPSRACLASRIPYGEPLSAAKLQAVENAEEVLAQEGFRQVRVRHHGDLARIEVAPDELPKILHPDILHRLSRAIKGCGFRYVTLDADGYRTGSLNEALPVTDDRPSASN